MIRLKGGDPTIFGRIQEEMEVLKKAKIHYEIIPGVSSFYSAPAYSGIPVTSREISQGFSVLTGHFKNNWEEKEIAYSFNKTIIYLMAMKNFKKIINKHLMTGKKPETPVAIISKATTHEQECYVSTLKDLNESRQVFSHPGILVIGEIVREIEKFKWYEWTSFYKLSFYYLDNDLPVALAFYLLANGAAIHSLQFQNKIADNGILIISQKKIKDNRLVLSKNKKMIIIDDGQNESSMIKNKQMILKSNCWKERFILSSLQIQALNEFIKD